MDSLEVMKMFIEDWVTDYYDIKKIEMNEDTLVVTSKKCILWETAKGLKDKDLPEDMFCLGHQLFYNRITDDIDHKLACKFVKTLAHGDDHCEWVFKVL
ncbi:hypothetical protein ACFLWX_03885 [Chloroflexota bacterium]